MDHYLGWQEMIEDQQDVEAQIEAEIAAGTYVPPCPEEPPSEWWEEL